MCGCSISLTIKKGINIDSFMDNDVLFIYFTLPQFSPLLILYNVISLTLYLTASCL